jgi:EF hand
MIPIFRNKRSTSSGSRIVVALAFISALVAGLTGCAGGGDALVSARPVAITHDDFALADSNHDGKLSREEAALYLVFVVFTASDADADGRLTEAEWTQTDPARSGEFRECDSNGDGSVTLSEAIAYSHRDRAALAVIRQADRNHDGKLNRAEIDAYFLRVTGLSG